MSDLIVSSGTEPKPRIREGSRITLHFALLLQSGEEIDTTRRGQPATFSLGGIIPGWQEALQLMNEGARWEVVIPPELAYGETGAGGAIGPQETLIFEIELIEVK